jgi:hypothetical protein
MNGWAIFAMNPNGIQIIQPRVGPSRTGEELPWVSVQTISNPEWVASSFATNGFNPFRVAAFLLRYPA